MRLVRRFARSGQHYTFTNASYDGTSTSGASTGFGFGGAPESATPTSCTPNRRPCTGGSGGTDTTARYAPSGIHIIGTMFFLNLTERSRRPGRST